MVTLKPIKLLPARERVASALRKAIISKQIGEGEVITLEATAQQLGNSPYIVFLKYSMVILMPVPFLFQK